MIDIRHASFSSTIVAVEPIFRWTRQANPAMDVSRTVSCSACTTGVAGAGKGTRLHGCDGRLEPPHACGCQYLVWFQIANLQAMERRRLVWPFQPLNTSSPGSLQMKFAVTVAMLALH